MPYDDGQILTNDKGEKVKYDAKTNEWSPYKTPVAGVGGTTPEDFVKSLEPAAVKTGAAIAGMPGDVYDMASAVKKKFNTPAPQEKKELLKLGATELPKEAESQVPPWYTSAGMTHRYEKQFGPLHEPQSGLTKGMVEAGPMVAALMGGPESMGARLATRIAAPYAAGKAVESVTDNPYLKLGAQVATPMGLRGFASPTRIKNPDIRGEVANVQDAIKPHGAMLPASARTGSKRLAWLEEQTGLPEHMTPDALNRAHTAAQLEGIGVKGSVNSTKVDGVPTVIPDRMKEMSGEYQKGNAQTLHGLANYSGQWGPPDPAKAAQIAAWPNKQQNAAVYALMNKKGQASRDALDTQNAVAHDLNKVANSSTDAAAQGLLLPSEVNQATKRVGTGASNVLATNMQSRMLKPDTSSTDSFVKALTTLGGAGVAGLVGNKIGSSQDLPGFYGINGGAGAGALAGGGAGYYLVPPLLKGGLRTGGKIAAMNPVTQWWLSQQHLKPSGAMYKGSPDAYKRNIGAATGLTADIRNPDPEQQ